MLNDARRRAGCGHLAGLGAALASALVVATALLWAPLSGYAAAAKPQPVQPTEVAKKPAAAKDAPAGFPIQINGRALHYQVNFEPVMPGQEVVFSTAPHLSERLTVRVDGVGLASKNGRFSWRAPQSTGTHQVEFALRADGTTAEIQTITASLLVMLPAKRISNGYLNGYRIGQYPPPLKNLSTYKAPAGFIEVTVKNQNLRISPNFTLGQFVCKQTGGYPKYLALQPALLNKLEAFLLEVNSPNMNFKELIIHCLIFTFLTCKFSNHQVHSINVFVHSFLSFCFVAAHSTFN